MKKQVHFGWPGSKRKPDDGAGSAPRKGVGLMHSLFDVCADYRYIVYGHFGLSLLLHTCTYHAEWHIHVYLIAYTYIHIYIYVCICIYVYVYVFV